MRKNRHLPYRAGLGTTACFPHCVFDPGYYGLIAVSEYPPYIPDIPNGMISKIVLYFDTISAVLGIRFHTNDESWTQ